MKNVSSQYVLDSSKEYSIYVCENRAIPSVIDGLKAAQRKALWIIRNKNEKIKTVSLSGEMISSNLYVHGDASASGTISQLAAPFCNNVPLLEGIGTFGTRVAPTEFASPRYTYVKKGKAAKELVYTDLDIVPLKENYDGSTKEPVHFLPLIPNVLLNGISGIAVGWSTEILPRKFEDLVQSCIDVLNGKAIKKLVPHYERYYVSAKHIEDNKWEFTGRAEIEDSSTVKINELPPDTSLEKFKERLNSLEEEGKIKSYIDRSTKRINITIKMQRGSVRDWSESDAINYFKLRQQKTERIVVINWNNSSIRQYDTAEKLVKDFVQYRLGWYTTRYEKLKADAEYELNYWRALERCFECKLPSKLSKMKNKKEVESNVQTFCSDIILDNSQIDKISSLPSYRWTGDSFDEILLKTSELEVAIFNYKEILSDPEKLKAIYKEELINLSKMKFD